MDIIIPPIGLNNLRFKNQGLYIWGNQRVLVNSQKIVAIMVSEAFYDLIDKELESLINEYKDDLYFKKNKSNVNNCKSRAFLIWFLKFYGKTDQYIQHITDGDGDHSCDIIFDAYDNQENHIYYIVQSKWNVKGKCHSSVEKAQVLQAINEFDSIIRGHKLTTENKTYQAKVQELQEHIKHNGEIKIIYLTLCSPNKDAEDNINAFLLNHKKTSFEWIDLERLKIDYINRKYKEIEPINPLSKYYNPEEENIELSIKQHIGGRSFIHIDKPFEAFVFLLKPSTIYNLFEKYGFLLFQKNVRNPLMVSELNQQIEKTITDNPAFFWYYNNGLTAITYLLPEIRNEAETATVTGLQIINGAQTVYSIYKAYKDASPVKRQIMDSESFVTLRILKSGGKDFDLNVTRFTNSQNPVSDRDFVANDEVQKRLQEESFKTSFWYEKRRGEFRNRDIEGVQIVSNEVFAKLYLAYFLHDPIKVSNVFSRKNNKFAFISHKQDKNGLYEVIFNENTSFKDMLAAYQIQSLIECCFEFDISVFSQNIILLSLFSYIAKDYYKIKYDANFEDVSIAINKGFQSDDIDTFLKILKYINNSIYNADFIIQLKNDESDSLDKDKNDKIDDNKQKGIENEIMHNLKLITSSGYFEKIKDELTSRKLALEDIDNLDISKEKALYFSEIEKNKDQKEKTRKVLNFSFNIERTND
ncbi:AIPR family protein [Bacteroides fragilis]|uniref:AIPR family protein n=1 Tax=Bacteroides fragilis TaxID=817 RepID=UPI000EFE7FE0|nr:AIPR family protein [Bacteroides fragilis]RHD52812.1 abortive phage infection protein [Bacteroides fragilis]